MIIFRPTWDGWAHLLALSHGQVLNAQQCTWLMWERTAYPMTTDLAYLGGQLHDALEHPRTDEDFMDAQDPNNREAERLAVELGVVARNLQDMEGQYHEVVADVASLRAENARLEETVAGWRAENDRHRHLYVEATKDQAKAERLLGLLQMDFNDVCAERDLLRDDAVPEAARIMNELTAERDALRHLVRHLWAAWNDATLALHQALAEHVAGSPLDNSTLNLTREQRSLLETTIRWSHGTGEDT